MPETGDLEGDLTKFERLKEWTKQDQNHSKKWRQEAREAFDFVSGAQWTDEDQQFLKLYNRPVITFNRIDPVVDSVTGLEVNNRQEVRYFPRHIGDAGVDELLSGAAKWCRDECNAEDEESDAFRDEIICGMGWTETRIDYDEDPDGKMMIERTDALEMLWDFNSKKKNLADARRITRIRDVPLSVAMDMFPDVEESELHASWALDAGDMARDPHDALLAPFYEIDQTDLIDKNRTLCRIVETQWWEHEKVIRTIDPATGQQVSLEPKEHKILTKRLKMMGLQVPPFVKQNKKKFYKAFLGNKVLEQVDGPEEGGFTYKCMTGKRDRNKGCFYGLVRAMIDPQKWANKWLSQVMHIVNTNAKAGIMAEQNAFENPQEAIDNWADPSAVTLMKNGALSGPGGPKVMPKPQTPWPSGLEGLMQFAISSIRDVSGVNLELLGQADRTQPGVLEHQRKQSAMTILASLFDSLRRYRKDQGRLMLYYITHFMSDGRLVRIGGPQEAQYIPLVRQPDTTRYDVIVDDTPNSVNLKEQAWMAITQLMPMLSRINIPLPVWLDVLKYSPLPASLVADITKTLQQQSQQPPPPDPKVQAAQLDLQGKQLDLQMQQSEQQDTQIRAQVDMIEAQNEAVNTAQQGALIGAQTFKEKTAGILNLAKAKESAHNAAMVPHDAALQRHDAGLNTVTTMVDALTKMNPPPKPTATP